MSSELAVAIGYLIEFVALGVEMLAVAVIAAGVVLGTARYFFHHGKRDLYLSYRQRLGKTLLMGLELLVAADVVRTIALKRTLGSVAMLGLLVFIRTFLSWSLVVELDGRWPWSEAEKKNGIDGAGERIDDKPPGE